jgi:segregation and condensation protein B
MLNLQLLRGGRDRGLPKNRRLPAIYRLGEVETGEQAHGELARDRTLATIEAALITADEPLSAKRLATVADLADAAEARRLVRALQALYDRDGTAFQVEELAGGFQLLTRPQYHPWLVRVRRAATELRLSPAARETLAIVAYRQPITRADVEAIRGVGSSDVLQQLMEKGVVRIVGRDDSLGRPMLYGTTKKFLQTYGLRTLRDLPRAREFQAEAGARKKTRENSPPKKEKQDNEDEHQQRGSE